MRTARQRKDTWGHHKGILREHKFQTRHFLQEKRRGNMDELRLHMLSNAITFRKDVRINVKCYWQWRGTDKVSLKRLSEYSVHTFANQPSFLVSRLHDLTRVSFSSELSNSKDDSKPTLSNTALLLCKSWTKFNNLLLRRREPRIPAMRAFSISKMDSHSCLLEFLQKLLLKLWNKHSFAM